MQALLLAVLSSWVFVRAFAAERRKILRRGAAPLEDTLRSAYPDTVVLDLLVLMLPRLLRRLWAACLMAWASLVLVMVHLSFLAYASRLSRFRVADAAVYAVLLLLLTVAGGHLARLAVGGTGGRELPR